MMSGTSNTVRGDTQRPNKVDVGWDDGLQTPRIVVPLLNYPERAPVDLQDNIPVLDNEGVIPEMVERP